MGQAQRKPGKSGFIARKKIEEAPAPKSNRGQELQAFIEGRLAAVQQSQANRGQPKQPHPSEIQDRVGATIQIEWGYKRALKKFCWHLRAEGEEDTPDMSDVIVVCLRYGWDAITADNELGQELIEKATERRAMTRLIQFPEWRDEEDGQNLAVRVRTTINIEAELKHEVKEYVYVRRGKEDEDTPDMNDIFATCLIYCWDHIERETELGKMLLERAYQRRALTRMMQFPECHADHPSPPVAPRLRKIDKGCLQPQGQLLQCPAPLLM